MFGRAVTLPLIANPGRLQRKSCLAITVLLVLLASTSTRLCGHTSTTGEITGVVMDPGDAVVPNSSVTLKNIETGATVAATTNSQGIYTFTLLQPVSYQVSVTARGFSMVTKTVLATRSTFASLTMAVPTTTSDIRLS